MSERRAGSGPGACMARGTEAVVWPLGTSVMGDSATVSMRRLHGYVAHRLAVSIIGGETPPGSVLPNEEQASSAFGVSRTAYREAIRMLAAKGLVEAQPKTGTRVAQRSRWNLLDPDVLGWHFEVEPSPTFISSLFELRLIVEPAAAAMAAERRDDGDIADLADALSRFAALGTTRPEGLEADLAFHTAILRATRNEPLTALSSVINAALHWSVRIKLDAPRGRSPRLAGGPSGCVRCHRPPRCGLCPGADGCAAGTGARRHDAGALRRVGTGF